MLWVETPTNPMLEVADLPALVEAAHAAARSSAVDNTFATPLVQRPFEHGADVVVHSVTKYLAGHTDVVLGAALADDDDLHARLHAYRTLHGSIAGPFEVWLALRGLRTLALRVERAQANAAELARRLSRAPRRRARSGTRACRPTPATSAPRALMDGFGAIIGLRPHGGPRRGGRASSPRCGSGCPRRASAASSRRWSAVAGSPPSRPPCPRTCCGCRSASRTSRTSGGTWQQALRRSGVMSREVGQSGDWWLASEGGVGAVVIVEVEPAGQGGVALVRLRRRSGRRPSRRPRVRWKRSILPLVWGR